MYKTKDGNIIKASEINLIISNIVIEVIGKNIPHKWIPAKELFFNIVGKACYDYSGELEQIDSVSDIDNIISDFKPNNSLGTTSPLDALFSELYIGRWEATYCSNYGKHWVSYKDVAEEKYNEWKYSSFQIFNEDGEYCCDDEIDMEICDIELDKVFYRFFRDTPIDLYYQKIKNLINK